MDSQFTSLTNNPSHLDDWGFSLLSCHSLRLSAASVPMNQIQVRLYTAGRAPARRSADLTVAFVRKGFRARVVDHAFTTTESDLLKDSYSM